MKIFLPLALLITLLFSCSKKQNDENQNNDNQNPSSSSSQDIPKLNTATQDISPEKIPNPITSTDKKLEAPPIKAPGQVNSYSQSTVEGKIVPNPKPPVLKIPENKNENQPKPTAVVKQDVKLEAPPIKLPNQVNSYSQSVVEGKTVPNPNYRPSSTQNPSQLNVNTPYDRNDPEMKAPTHIPKAFPDARIVTIKNNFNSSTGTSVNYPDATSKFLLRKIKYNVRVPNIPDGFTVKVIEKGTIEVIIPEINDNVKVCFMPNTQGVKEINGTFNRGDVRLESVLKGWECSQSDNCNVAHFFNRPFSNKEIYELKPRNTGLEVRIIKGPTLEIKNLLGDRMPDFENSAIIDIVVIYEYL